MNIQTIPLAQLNPAEYNPRIITKDEFEGLKTSIKTFGQQENLIVNKDMTLISGHQRLNAMLALGIKEAACNVVDLDKHQEKKLNVIMNSTAISGKYDDLKLSEILDELKLDDDYESLRLNVLEPLDLSPTEVEEDEAPEVSQEPPVSKLGEIYQLGRHRVMCGDSTDQASVELLMDGIKADMVFTDPPYGMDYSGRGENTNNKIMGDNIDPTEFYNIGSEISERYIWGRVENYKHLAAEPRDTIIWKKNNFGMGRGYRGQYECCFYYGDFSGSDSDVWELPKDSKYEHPTQKPVSLCVRAIQNSQPKIVIDYFLGSGSTLIACEQTDRTCYGMELDPKYVDVIRKRYAKFIGKEDEWQEVTPRAE